jgi:hypothetical protein
MSLQTQFSRYGAIARVIPELAPGAKVFLVSDSDDTTVGPLNLGAEFPSDNEGVARVYTTIQAAVNAASANRGDVVLVLPGYDQSLAGIDSWDKAGVQIIGLPAGGLKPTVRFTAKTSEVGISASNIRVSGLRFLAATDSIARAVDLDTGFSNIRFDNNTFDFDTLTNDFRVMLRHGSPRSVIENNRFIAEDTAGAGAGIRFKGGAPSYSTIRNNFFYGQFDTVGDTSDGGAAIAQDTTDTADTNFSGILIENNTIVSTDTAATAYVRVSAGYTVRGILKDNRFVSYDSTTADTTRLGLNTGVNKGLRASHNYMVGDSGTEKLLGDTFVLSA